MQRGFRIFSIILAILLAIYFSWSKLDRREPPIDVQLQIDSTYTIHKDAGKGNIVGINAYMLPQDYASGDHFFAKLDGYMQAAKLEGWLSPKTTVLFPEYIGTWLIVEREKSSIYKAATVDEALSTFVSANFFRYIRAWFMAPDGTEDKIKHSVFASKSERMARIYREEFSKLAQKYGVTIVAGSILLQEPSVAKSGTIRIKNGPLYNVSAVFNPDGSLQKELILKSFPIADEKPFIAPSPIDQLPVFDLPSGKTSVLICADSWFPEIYQAAAKKQAEILLVPSYTQPNNVMDQPWQGYSGFAAPTDTDTLDMGKISLREAWIKYTLPGRIKSSGASAGVNVTLKGKLWNLGTDGEFIVVSQDSVYTGKPGNGASMVCLYLQ
jgi:predicted amidohydrolase